ncbi:hypothetical protein HHK36_029259 [Tetracentron sinense]|uniref:Uncharacterized protein n=1 Tax=Tetracentron sinense TaxID=13715 RepID=A0A835D1F3_TETSI|nr:hypothetical protein HHK36_029259 [Tetracentron sinense]
MKGSGTLVASVLAASTVALTSSGERDVAFHPCSNEDSSSSGKDAVSSSRRSSEKGKFAPRFDGLRFIETLVTAHR